MVKLREIQKCHKKLKQPPPVLSSFALIIFKIPKLQIMKVILISLFFISYTSYCQDKGIRFEHGLLWNEILEKAKSENKFIFIDAYTTWCGPCRYMSTAVFTQEKVGDFFNKNFINVKLQIDSTENDSDEVKQWYATAHQFSQQYNIIGYPTFLFFDANGEAVHKILAGAEADEFLEKTAKALNPKTQYYTLLNKYNNGEKSSSFLFDLSNAALDAYEMTLGKKVAKEYFRTKAALTSNEDLKLLFNCTFSKADTGFKLILKNPQQFNSALGEKEQQKIS